MAHARCDLRNLVELTAYGAQAEPAANYQLVYELPGEQAAGQWTQLSHAQLAQRAAGAAAALHEHGVRRTDRLLLVVPATAFDSALVCLLGGLQLGCVMAPLAQPLTAAELKAYSTRLSAAARCSNVSVIVGPAKLLERLNADGCEALPALKQVTLESLTWTDRPSPVVAEAQPSDEAVLLFEDAADGVAARSFSHADLLCGLDAASRALELSERDVLASWLPLAEDAGLLAALLPLYCRSSAVFLPTTQFLRRPAAWLQVMSQARASVSFAPKQAFALCAQRVRPQELAGVDLTRLRCVASVREPLSAETRAAFELSVAPTGLATGTVGNVFVPALVQNSEAPLSHGQEALWFLAQLAPDSLAYNVNFCLRICSPYDAAALQASVQAIVQRHSTLRSVIATRAGIPHRRLLASVPSAFTVVDAAGWDDAELTRRMTLATEHRFDFARGPLFFVKLFVRSASDAFLLIVAHHIVVDGWSKVRVVTELGELYPRALGGESLSKLRPHNAYDYDDFVRWQAQLLGGNQGERLRAYWRQQLLAAPWALDLPLDHVRPPVQSYSGAMLELSLPSELTAQLRALAQRNATTLYTLLLALFQTLLHKLSGQRDLLVGSPSMGRSEQAFAEVVGFFVNTLPIRAQIDPERSFEVLLAQTRVTSLSALDCQDLPFSQMVELAQAPRDPSRPPLCQVLFQLHTYGATGDVVDTLQGLAAGGRASIAGLTVEPYPLARQIAQFELSLELADFGTGVAGHMEYNSDLFERATVQRWAAALIELAAAVVRDPGAALASHVLVGIASSESPPLPPEQRALVIEHWNDTAQAYPEGRVHHAIAACAARHPERIALCAGDETMSYAELDRRANSLAQHLRSLTAAPDVLIGVCMDRSIELVVVLLGVMKSGAAYVPLDPSYPAERLRFMVNDARPALIIADAAYVAQVDLGVAPVLRAEQAASAADSEAPAVDVSASDLVHVIYTSGSTGTPKGVCNTHAGLWNRLMWMQQYFELRPDDCVLHKTPYSFDVSVWELFWPLMFGARLALAKVDGQRDSRYLRDEVARYEVTTIHFVPSMFEAFLLEPELSRCRSLRRVICSGEALPYALLLRSRECLPQAELYNLYGPTEASIDVTAWHCVPNARAIVPIGRPIANTQIYILDPEGRPVAIGASGELHIGGVGLARGYHARPELSAERFVANPFSSDPTARLYKTGDLARFDADGCIEYLGRNDLQVKVRGFRVELGEIEAALRAHPGVQSCAVVAVQGQSLRIEAFVVPAADAPTSDALQAYLGERLPAWMVPSGIRCVAQIPLTHSGKVDRKALLAQCGQAALTRQAHVAPHTPVQQILAQVFEQVLGLRDISIHDNYFALGGDSIRSLQVRALAEQHGLRVEVPWLLTHQTIAELASAVGRVSAPAELRATAPFELLRGSERATLSECADAYPATRLQLGMLYHSELTHDSWAYHDVMSLKLELGAPWQPAAMETALQGLIERHPVLRSAFDVGSYTRPLQVVAHTAPLPLQLHDARELGADAAGDLIHAHIAAEKSRGYALSVAPLFRLAIHVLAERQVQLTLSFHHAILDGWSTATLLQELLTDYLRAAGVQSLPSFQAPAHGFSAFVALEDAAVQSEPSRAYFLRTLDDAQLTCLPRWPEAHRQVSDTRRVVMELDPALTDKLRELSGQQRAPLKALLMAAHVRVLAAFTGAADVVTGWVVHGRPELPEAERILGLFLNTLPTRFKPLGVSWTELIAQVVQTDRALHPHRRFPLHDILRLLDRPALFETAFNFVHFHQYESLFAAGALRVLDFESHENTGFALMVNCVLHPGENRLSLHLEYDPERVARPQAEQLARAHVLALEHMLQGSDRVVSSAELIDAAESQRLTDFRRGVAASAATPLHALFERQARETPQRIAVELAADALSYAALDGWANLVAQQLIAAGALPHEAIAVCAEPSLQRVAAVLGVLKAGCTLLPLDAEYPVERLEYMLERADVQRALVTPSHAGATFFGSRQVLVIDERGAAAAPGVQVGARDPAYIIFTSGSTGRPKGILMPHEPLANIVAWQLAHDRLDDGAATAQFSLFGFDISFQEMFSTWAAGGRLVLVPDSARKDARQLVKLLSERQVARLFVPVVALHQLAEVAEQLQLSLPALREINSAGEQLEITTALRAFFTRHPGCRLQNQYGPSETHVATSYLLPEDVSSWVATPPVGQPLPGVRGYVLDQTRSPSPIGVQGSLFLAGPCVGLGYCNDAAQTAERFGGDAFHPSSGDRMYDTGDLVRWLPDGNLEYCGRRDSQLKIRGFRVELGEIESALVAVSQGSVQRAAVIAIPAPKQPKRLQLWAYVARARGHAPDPEALRAALARRLPPYMLPQAIEVLDALPIAPSGKLDRRALPLPAASTSNDQHAGVKELPSTALETELCGLWQEVLSSSEQPLGVSDDFFASGGDSLSAVRLMARVQRRFGVELPISVLLEARTIRGLARAIAAAGPVHSAPCLIRLGGEGPRPAVFCVHPVGGHALCYVSLAQRLGADQPFFGLQARGLSGTEPPLTSVTEMASAYAAEIIAAQPSGSLHLAGWSFGGVVAVELARQLALAGRSVAPVVVIDSVATAHSSLHMSEDDLIEFVALELFGVQVDEAVLSEDRGSDRAARLARLRKLVQERGLSTDAVSGSSALERVLVVVQRNIQAVFDHRPRVYEGKVVLLRCTEQMPARLARLHDLAGTTYADASNGWSAYCPQLEVVPVAGDHVSVVFEPHVGAVASILRAIVSSDVVS